MYNTCILSYFLIYYSLTLTKDLRKVVVDCLEHYLNHDIRVGDPNSLQRSRESRRNYLKAWLAPWNKGLNVGFPQDALTSMLEKTASFSPELHLDDKAVSVFSTKWRTVVGDHEDLFKDFVSPKLRSAMSTVVGNLRFHPLWLLMSISAHAGIYQPMMGFAENASWWHQVPPMMEALIIYELAMALDHDKGHKTGKMIDRRAGIIMYVCMYSTNKIHVGYI